MIEDGKPIHWPKMIDTPQGVDEQSAIKALADVRRLIVAYRKLSDGDWRVHHARTDHIVNVVAGLIADATAIQELFDAADRKVTPLQDQIKSLTEQLAEARRPFTAQMEMQNKRIIGLTAELDRLRGIPVESAEPGRR